MKRKQGSTGMGDVYDNNKSTRSSSSPQDEISLFLNQILHRSSAPPHVGKNEESLMSFTSVAGLCSKNATQGNAHSSYRSSLFRDGVSTSSGVFLSSSSVGVSENETDEYDCESEEGVDALADEVPEKSVPPRSSSKRSRAAEVHNLSEKRRRSRINEKLKALQNLIPNSNKTDKASMLDEAIEYLKQLQLQVQMLSMRNGSSLLPTCFPEGLQPMQLSRMRMEFAEENRSMPLSVASPSYIMNSETSLGLEPHILAHLRPFHQKRPSQEIYREDILQHQQLNANHSDTNQPGVSRGFHLICNHLN